MKRIFPIIFLSIFVVQCATRRDKKIFTKKGDSSPAQTIQKAAKDFNDAVCKTPNPPPECATTNKIANATEDEINDSIVGPLKESSTSDINGLQNSAGVVIGGGALPEQTSDAAASAPPPSDSGSGWSQWAGDLTWEQWGGATLFLTGALTLGSGVAMSTPKERRAAIQDFLKKGGGYDKIVQLKTEQQKILHKNIARNMGLTEAQIAEIDKKLGRTPSTFVDGQAPKTAWENWKKIIVDTVENEVRSGQRKVGESSLDMMKYIHEVTATNEDPGDSGEQKKAILEEIEKKLSIEVSDAGDVRKTAGSTLTDVEVKTMKEKYGSMLGELKQNKQYRTTGAETGAGPYQKLPGDVKSASGPDRPSKPTPQMEARAKTRAQMDAPKSKFQEAKMGAAFIAGGLLQMGAGAAAMYYGQGGDGALGLAESADAVRAARYQLLQDLGPAFSEITGK